MFSASPRLPTPACLFETRPMINSAFKFILSSVLILLISFGWMYASQEAALPSPPKEVVCATVEVDDELDEEYLAES